MEDKKIRVAITHGDTNGIGYEMIFKAFAEPEMLELCTPIIYGSPKVAAYHRKALDLEANFSIINSAEEACNGRINLLPCFDDEVKIDMGTPTQESGEAALKALDKAMTDFRHDAYDVLVTAPICNSNVKGEGFKFKGTDSYVETCIGDGKKGLALYINNSMRIATVTNSVALKDVSNNISQEGIITKAQILFNALKRDFRISCPRIAVLALNPDAGSTEEENIIKPAIAKLAENGINAFGPYPAERFFGSTDYDAFDAILAMYHDQGAIPLHTLSPSDNISLLTGLPIVCTAPYCNDIFCTDKQQLTDENPLRQAIYLAIDTFRNRNEYDEPMGNPLRKLYHEKRDESEKVRFSIPKKHEQTAASEQ